MVEQTVGCRKIDELNPLDVAEGCRLRDEAIDRTEQANDEFVDRAERIVRDLARARDEFTTDAVWYLLEKRGAPVPDEPRAMGAVMRRASSYGLIEATDRTVQSVRPGCHRRPIRVWRSLVSKVQQ